MADRVRVTASGAGAAYVPHYLAQRLGLYAAEGLEVQTDAPGGAMLAGNLASGAAEVALGGVWRPLMYLDRLETFRAFALLCIRNPQVLLARSPLERFEWSALRGTTVVLPAGAPSPGIFFAAALQAAGLAPEAVRVIREFQTEEAVRLFRAGLGDFLLVMPPLSERLARDGFPVATTLAAATGTVPWSVFYATPDFLDRADQPATRFARALQRALRWVAEHPPEDAARASAADFPGLDPDTLAGAIRRARDNGLWPAGIHIPQEPLDRWQRTLVAHGLYDRPVPYPRIVDSRPAEALEPAGRG
jgi:NitT/TauT family transport system substrate-binding protein